MPTISNIASLAGMLLGTAGFILGLLSYLRDSPRIKIYIDWYEIDRDNAGPLGVVRVTNVSRRTVFITAAGLQTAGGLKFECYTEKQLSGMSKTGLPIPEMDVGVPLGEGFAPTSYIIESHRLYARLKSETRVKGFATDSTGKKHFSKWERWHKGLALWDEARMRAEENGDSN